MNREQELAEQVRTLQAEVDHLRRTLDSPLHRFVEKLRRRGATEAAPALAPAMFIPAEPAEPPREVRFEPWLVPPESGGVLVIGADSDQLARCRSHFGAVKVRNDLKLSGMPTRFSVILVFPAFTTEQIVAAADGLANLCTDTLYLLHAGHRETVEKPLFHAGFRKHDMASKALGFMELEGEKGGFTGFYQRIPDDVLARRTMEKLLEERDLHMDMFRETGHRSDAHLVRYEWASRYVKPGDVVVDAASGLGYGSSILASTGAEVYGFDISQDAVDYAADMYHCGGHAKFAVSDVRQLSALADQSVDVFVSFETLEHVPDPERIISEVKRVLKPGGTFIGSVPNLWCDETGNDPSPFHFIVFDLPKLVSVVSLGLEPLEAWGEWAGNAHDVHAVRRLEQFPLSTQREIHPEWWLIVARK